MTKSDWEFEYNLGIYNEIGAFFEGRENTQDFVCNYDKANEKYVIDVTVKAASKSVYAKVAKSLLGFIAYSHSGYFEKTDGESGVNYVLASCSENLRGFKIDLRFRS